MLSAARINAEYSRRQRLNDMSEVAGDQIVSEFSIFEDGEEVHGSVAMGREYTNLTIKDPINYVNDDETHSWTELQQCIQQESSLQSITYECAKKKNKASGHLKTLFTSISDENHPLNSVNFNNISFDHELVTKVMRCMVNGTSSTHTPVSIKLTHAKLDDSCAQVIVNAMNGGLRIRCLNLTYNSITDEGIERLLSPDNDNLQYITELNISNNKLRSLDSIAAFIGRDDCNVEQLQIQHTQNIAKTHELNGILNSMPTSKLQCINLGKHLKLDGIDLLLNMPALATRMETILCNPSSFDEFINQSNHTISTLSGGLNGQLKDLNANVKEALTTNLRSDLTSNQKCRRKLRYVYFTDDFDVTPFIELDTVYIPEVLELVTMSEERCEKREGRNDKGTYVLARNGHVGSIYRLIRHIPELFSFASPMQTLIAKNEELESKITKLELELEQFRLSNKRCKTK